MPMQFYSTENGRPRTPTLYSMVNCTIPRVNFAGAVLSFVAAALVGCQAAADFRAITSAFTASKTAGVSKIELYPIDVGDSRVTLDRKITLTDAQANASIIGEITFPESPQLPKTMQHAGDIGACKMLIYFRSGTVFCLCVWFREGGAGNGAEYAVHPDLHF